MENQKDKKEHLINSSNQNKKEKKNSDEKESSGINELDRPNRVFLRKSLGSLYKDMNPGSASKVEKKDKKIGLDANFNLSLSPEELQSFNKAFQDKNPEEHESEKNHEIGENRPFKKEMLPPNIYDILLRVMYHFQVDWLLLTDQGLFLGIISKKYVLSMLSQIRKLNDPLIKYLPEKTGFFPSVLEALEAFRLQIKFPLIDRTGQVLDQYSRGQTLDLIEKSNNEGNIIPLLLAGNHGPHPSQEFASDQSYKKIASQSDKGTEDKIKDKNDSPAYSQNIDWFMSLMLENIPYGLAVIDNRFRLIFYNEKFKLMIKGRDVIGNITKFEKIIEKKIKSKKIILNQDLTGKVGEFIIKEFSITVMFSFMKTNRNTIGYILSVTPIAD